MTDSQMNQILSHLEKEIVLYRKLLEVVAEERAVLLEGRHEDLLAISEHKLRLSHRLVEVQQARRDLMASLVGPGERPLRLSDLGGRLSGEERSLFQAVVDKAAALARRLGLQNQTNRRYLEEALDTVEHLLSILSARGEAPAYDRVGKGQCLPGGPRMLAREV